MQVKLKKRRRNGVSKQTDEGGIWIQTRGSRERNRKARFPALPFLHKHFPFLFSSFFFSPRPLSRLALPCRPPGASDWPWSTTKTRGKKKKVPKQQSNLKH